MRKREQRQAQQEFSRNKARYEGLDTSNQYTNLENTYEDLTVNTQAADFAAQKQQQVLANTMSGMQGAAGGGGIGEAAMLGVESQAPSSGTGQLTVWNGKPNASILRNLQSLQLLILH